jgi:hypothetical protein
MMETVPALSGFAKKLLIESRDHPLKTVPGRDWPFRIVAGQELAVQNGASKSTLILL